MGISKSRRIAEKTIKKRKQSKLVIAKKNFAYTGNPTRLKKERRGKERRGKEIRSSKMRKEVNKKVNQE